MFCGFCGLEKELRSKLAEMSSSWKSAHCLLYKNNMHSWHFVCEFKLIERYFEVLHRNNALFISKEIRNSRIAWNVRGSALGDLPYSELDKMKDILSLLCLFVLHSSNITHN
jgi:hypothetical protein